MTPEEKAKELVKKFEKGIFSIGYSTYSEQRAKQCAIICCDEVSNALIKCSPDYAEKTLWHPIDYWEQVKEKIKSL